MQIHVSRNNDQAQCAQHDLSGRKGNITAAAAGTGTSTVPHFVADGRVKVVGSDVDMIVFRKHWSLEKVFHPISPTHI